MNELIVVASSALLYFWHLLLARLLQYCIVGSHVDILCPSFPAGGASCINQRLHVGLGSSLASSANYYRAFLA